MAQFFEPAAKMTDSSSGEGFVLYRQKRIRHWRLDETVDHDEPITKAYMTVDELLSRDVIEEPGTHVLFFPNIEENFYIDDSDLEKPLSAENKAKKKELENVCSALIKKFSLPDFFFERVGWNANGFFGSVNNPLKNANYSSYNTFARFLSKTVWEDKNASEEEAAEYGYDWHFMAFCSLWRSRTLEYSKAPVIPATNILICFDLQDHQQDDMIKIVRERHSTQSKNDPFHLLQLASSFVMKQFELDLWTFQKPIRNIEKARDNALQRSAKDELLFKRRFKGYTSMHELSRHVIHISESLNVASNNLLAIARDHQDLTPSIRSTNTTKALQLHANMLSNLRLRADAFVERMNNEIGCASNLVSVEILDQTRDDGKSLASTVSVLTLLFLPGTFMSGFFGMNFFDISSDGSSWVVSPQIYVFFICTIPITLLGFLIFILELNMLRWTKNASKPMRDYVHRRFFNAPVKPASQA